MKHLLLAASFLVIAGSASAKPELLKSCHTVSTLEAVKAEMTIEFLKDGTNISAKNITKVDGREMILTQEARVTKLNVRAGLSSDILESESFDDLNDAEQLIVHALTLTESPEMEGTQSAGLDLRAVVSAKVYTVVEEEEVNIGSVSVVEAYDKSGKNLGSFLGGFLVSPCK